MMLKEIAVSLCAAGLLWLLCTRLRGAMLVPVRPGKNLRLRLEITAVGSAPELEQTVDALLWLRANGTLPAEIVLCDAGMDSGTAAVAEALAKTGAVGIVD